MLLVVIPRVAWANPREAGEQPMPCRLLVACVVATWAEREPAENRKEEGMALAVQR